MQHRNLSLLIRMAWTGDHLWTKKKALPRHHRADNFTLGPSLQNKEIRIPDICSLAWVVAHSNQQVEMMGALIIITMRIPSSSQQSSLMIIASSRTVNRTDTRLLMGTGQKALNSGLALPSSTLRHPVLQGQMRTSTVSRSPRRKFIYATLTWTFMMKNQEHPWEYPVHSLYKSTMCQAAFWFLRTNKAIKRHNLSVASNFFYSLQMNNKKKIILF